jgi:hypothetical protein
MIMPLRPREIGRKMGESFSVVSGMADVRNRAPAAVAKAGDFIVSDEPTGLLLTRVSENGELLEVFQDLSRSEGSETYPCASTSPSPSRSRPIRKTEPTSLPAED